MTGTPTDNNYDSAHEEGLDYESNESYNIKFSKLSNEISICNITYVTANKHQKAGEFQ